MKLEEIEKLCNEAIVTKQRLALGKTWNIT